VSVGPFWGRLPTHKAVSREGIAVYRFEAGKIVETWTNEDSLSLFMQLGILEAPAPAAEPAHSRS
jgi:predicted ester cyclase